MLARGGGLVLQLVSTPLLLRTLGVSSYALYTLVGGILMFMAFAQFGFSNLLTRKVAALLANGDRNMIAAEVWTAVTTVAIIALFLMGSLAIIEHNYGLHWLWGEAYANNKEILTWGFYFGLVIGLLTIVLNLFVGIQAGYQELHISNIYGGIGTLFAALTIASLCLQNVIDTRAYWVALYIPPLLVLCANTIHLLLRHRELAALQLRLDRIKSLILGGAAFMLVQTLLPLAQREGTRLILARHGELADVAKISVFFQLATILGGFVTMITQPMMGAIADAASCGNSAWIAARLSQLRKVCLLIGVATLALGVVVGPDAIVIWLGAGIQFTRQDFWLFSFYFAVVLQVHVNQVFLLAKGAVSPAVLASAVDITLLCIAFLSPISGYANMLLVITATHLLASGVITSRGLKCCKYDKNSAL